MKIAMFTNNYFPRISGVSVAVDFADRALRIEGHETRIIAPDYGEFSGQSSGHGGMEEPPHVIRIPAISFRKHKAALSLGSFQSSRILGIIEGFQPDIIHSSHPFLLGDSAHKAADTFSVPLVYTFHTLYEFFSHYVGLDIEIVRQVIRDFVTQYANNCDLVIAPTEPIRRHLVDTGVIREVAVVPTGVDTDRFNAVTKHDVEEFRKQHGLDVFDRILLYVGRITEEKNVIDAWLATEQLIHRGMNCCLFVCGHGPQKKLLKDKAAAAGLARHLVFGGFLDQDVLPKAYLASDVFLFPSKSDTQGIVLYEAQIAGLPIAAYDSMAAQACIDNGRNGILVPAENRKNEDSVRALSDAVERILQNYAAYIPHDIAEQYSLKSIGKQYTALFTAVSERRRAELPDRNNFIQRSRKRINRLDRHQHGSRG